MITIEISVDSVEAALAAEHGGAQRIELCSALSEGGVTPSLGLLRAVRKHCSLPVFVLIRPRGGDFLYSAEEFAVMREDIRIAAEAGADGVVLGLLTAQGTVDIDRTRELIEGARPMAVTFHRAFDMTRDLEEALDDVVRTGADRILTSGGKASALLGQDLLHRLIQAAGNRIVVLVGGGVRPGNVADVLHTTGATEIHSSMRSRVPSPMQFHATAVHLGHQGSDEYTRTVVVRDEVTALVKASSRLPTPAALIG